MIVSAPPVRWGIPDAVVAFLITPAIVGLTFLAGALGVQGTPALGFAIGLLFYALLVAALVVISWRRGQRSLRADFGLAFRWVDLPIGIGIAILAKIATVIVGVAVVLITGAAPQSGNFMVGDDPLWIVLTGVLLASLIAPLVEELLFRGLILRAVRSAVLRGRRSDPRPQPAGTRIQLRAAVVAILVSSAAFAVLHLYQAPGDPALFAILGIGTFVVGIMHGVITVVTGRLGPAIVSHVVFNGSGVLLQVLLAEYLPQVS